MLLDLDPILQYERVGLARFRGFLTDMLRSLVQEAGSVDPSAWNTPETAASACADRVVQQGILSCVPNVDTSYVKH